MYSVHCTHTKSVHKVFKLPFSKIDELYYPQCYYFKTKYLYSLL